MESFIETRELGKSGAVVPAMGVGQCYGHQISL